MLRGTLTIALLVLLVTLCQAAVIHVDVNGGGDYLSISEGIAAAGVGDTVLVAPGTYTGELNRNMGVASGKLVLSEQGREATIVDCEYLGRAFGLSGGAVVDGFTITHGQREDGSAIYAGNGSPGVRNCLITENTGYAMVCFALDPGDYTRVDDCTFLRNGAGISSQSHLWVTDSEFIENDGVGVASYPIGDHFTHRCNVSGSVFHANGGRGVSVAEEDGTISKCVFTENRTGAVGIWSGWTDVTECTIVRNSSATLPAIQTTQSWEGGGPRITNSIIAFNECAGALGDAPEAYTLYNFCYGNAGGDTLHGQCSVNFFIDPVLCDVYGGDVSPCADSPALVWGGGAGAFDEPGCGACGSPVERSSWGRLKALYR